MSYDLYTFRCPPGADPSEVATDLVESFDQEISPAELPRHEAAVLALIAAYREEFPDIEIVEQEPTTAMGLIDERLVSIDIYADHTDICISYGVAKDGDWLIDRLTRIARGAAKAGHDTLFDAQLDEAIDPAADWETLVQEYDEGLEMVTEIRDEHERETSGGGLLRRLFRRG